MHRHRISLICLLVACTYPLPQEQRIPTLLSNRELNPQPLSTPPTELSLQEEIAVEVEGSLSAHSGVTKAKSRWNISNPQPAEIGSCVSSAWLILNSNLTGIFFPSQAVTQETFVVERVATLMSHYSEDGLACSLYERGWVERA